MIDDSIYNEKTTLDEARKKDYALFRGIEVHWGQFCNGKEPSILDLEKVGYEIDLYKARMAIQPWNDENMVRIAKIGKIEERLNKLIEEKSELNLD